MPEPDLTDPDNPEWTSEDFARAKGPESLPLEVLAGFPKTVARLRGPGRKPAKRQQTLRLDPDVVAYFKAGGQKWQTRINAVLREVMERRG